MKFLRSKRSQADVVARLRVAFFSIVLILVLGTSLSLLYLRQIHLSEVALRTGAIPELSQTEAIQRILHDGLRRLDVVDDVATRAELDDQRVAQDRLFAKIETHLDILQGVSKSPAQVTELGDFIRSLQSNTLKLLDLRAQSLAVTETIDAMTQRFSTLHKGALTTLERLAIHSEDRLADALSGRAGKPDLERAEAAIQSSLAKSANSELSARLDTIAALAAQLRNHQSTEQIHETYGLLSFNFNSSIQHLGDLPDTPLRPQLAQDLRAMHQLLNDPDAIVESAQKRAALAERRRTYMQVETKLAQAISRKASELLTQAHNGVDHAIGALEAARSRAVFMSSVKLIAVLSVVAVTGVFVVELQINRRMARLTTAVLRIAEGDLDCTVPMDGTDEIGRIATALNTFKKTAHDLRKSHAELKQISYVAAHDLRSPLRAIHDLAEWTLEDHGPDLAPEARENLKVLIARAVRMSNLLSDLLTYARVENSDVAMNRVHLADMVARLQEKMTMPRSFTLEVTGQDVTVETYDGVLERILHALICNAIKHHDRSEGRVTLAFTVQNGLLQASVADDGPGVAKEFHEKIFELFQTLKPRDLCEGSGLGLAVMKKLIEEFGGRYALHSDPENSRGSRFVVWLPMRICTNLPRLAA